MQPDALQARIPSALMGESDRSEGRAGPVSNAKHDWFLAKVFRHRGALRRFMARRAGPAEDVDDLVQETFLRVYAVADPAGVEAPKAMLFRVAHNLLVDRARRRAVAATDTTPDFDALGIAADAPTVEAQVVARERFRIFAQAVETLPPVCRRAFVLRKVHRLSHDEISELLGISRSTIEKHVAKGLVRCREILREHDERDAAAPMRARREGSE